LANTGWCFHTTLEEGIALAYKDYLSKGSLVAER
jgi:GDP-L-fucose synthase